MKKFYLPLLVATAVFAMPASALAANHWFKNGVEVAQNGKHLPTIGWGTLSLESAVGTITCENSSVGYVDNPVGGGNGQDATETFNPTSCTSACPEPIKVIAKGLPWPSELEEPEPGVIRDKFTGIEVEIICPIAGIDVVFSGENKPKVKNGTSASKPTLDVFGPGSGELTSVAGPGKTTGEAKTEGYEAQEVLTAH